MNPKNLLALLALLLVGCSSGPEPEAPPAPTGSASKFESAEQGATSSTEKAGPQASADQ